MAFGSDFTVVGQAAFGSDFNFDAGSTSTARQKITTSWTLEELSGRRRISSAWGIRVGVVVETSWVHPAGASISALWKVGQSRRLVSTSWSQRSGRVTALTWSYPAGAVKSLPWGNRTRQSKQLLWQLYGRLNQKINASWALTTNANQRITTNWAVLAVDRVSKKTRLNWALAPAPTALILPLDQTLTVLETGEVLDFKSATLKADESSWAWSVNIVMATAADWQKIRPVSGKIPVQINVRGHVFNLLCEGAGRSRGERGINYTIKGRSITSKLAKGSADQVTKTWLGSTAKAIAQELCDAAGITLIWQSADWPISRHEVANRYPIDIINQLAKAVGGVVQTSPAGELLIRPKYTLSPTQYNDQPADHILSDVDNIKTISEQWQARAGYDSIEVGNEAISTEPSISLSTEDAGGGAVLVKANVVPFQTIDLSHTAALNVKLLYQGVVSETVSQLVEIVDGKGRLSSPFYGLLSSAYKYTDLGAIEITENGDIKTAIGLHSLLQISYTTKYHTWRATSAADKAQLYIDEVA